MDNKRLFPVLFAILTLGLGWVYLVNYLDKTNPQWGLLRKQPEAVTAPTTAPSSMNSPTSMASTTMPTLSGITDLSSKTIVPVSAGKTQTVTLGSTKADDAEYAMAVTVSTRGAGVETVTLNRFKQAVERSDRYVFQTPSTIPGKGEDSRAFSSKSLTINGVMVNLSGLDWTLESSDPMSAIFSTNVIQAGGTEAILKLSKKYSITKTSDASLGYEMKLEYSLMNTTATPVSVVATMVGPSAPPWEIERGGERQVIRGYVSDGNKQIFARHTMVEEFKAQHTVIDMTKDGSNPYPLSWFGTAGQYFTAIVRPEPLAGAGSTTSPEYIGKVEGVLLNPEVTDLHLRDLITTMDTTSLALAPGQQITMPFKVFFGPKMRSVLDIPYYSAFPLGYDQTLVITTWLCSFCTFQWLIAILVAMLNVFHSVVRDWGVAIILLVGVVRLLLHPITRKAQQNMAKMQKMSPELNRIKEKYKDDKDGLNRAMMEFYKEQGATPIMGCLPMLLQTPIWIALYAGLQSTFELRHQPFLYGLTWIKDLAKPDHLIYFPTFNLFGLVPISGLNVIPFILAVVFFLQFKLQPKPPVQTPEQEQQQKMMQWMTLLFPVFLYSAPAGLNIYIMTSTTFGIIESKLIRDAIKRKDEARAAGTVDVIDRPRVTRKGGGAAAAVAPKKGLMGWLADMQEKAEEIRRQADKQQQKKK